MTSVYGLAAAQAERVPDATAVIAGERRTGYRELDRLATGLAKRLLEAPGGLVGVCLPRDERLVAALLAVWRTGRGYVPLDPSLPASRLAAMIAQAGVRTVVTTRELAPVVTATGAAVALAEAGDDDGPAPAVQHGDVACVLPTCGTPKGVVIEHPSVLALLDWMGRTIAPEHLRAGPVTASFDASVHGPWTTRQVSGFPGVTTEAFALGITGWAGSAELAAALEGLVVRHETLRTILRADRTRGEVLAPVPVSFTEHDARAMSEADIRRLMDQAARPSFASDKDVPLLCATLLRTADAAATLVIVVDRLAFDGWSGGILLSELAAELAGTEPAGPAVQLADVARWDERLFTPFADTDQAFWTTELAGARPPYGVARRPRSAPPGYRGARLVRPLAMETAGAVRELGTTTGLSEFSVYLAALDVLLARWSGIHDVLVGVPVARRDLAELGLVIGPLLSAVPLRVRWEPGQSFRAVATRAALTRNRALAHTNLPAGMLSAAADAAGVERPPGVPLAPVTLSVRPSGSPVRASAGDRELRALGELDTGAAPNEAAFLVNETAAGTEVQLCYDVDRFDGAEAGALLDGFLRVLAEGTADPDRACSAIEVPVPPRSESPPSTVGGRPRTASSAVVEEFLATTWAQLLLREVWDALGVELAVRTVFELPVLADLAAEAERRALAVLDGDLV